MIGVAEGGIVVDGGVDEIGMAKIFVEAFDAVVPELGFDAAEAALDPFGGDEGVDERELGGIGGLGLIVKSGGGGFEFGGVLAGGDVGPGGACGFFGVGGGAGFSLRGPLTAGVFVVSA